ncbi:SIMPL domain-containing protein [Kineosporia babensis]|uniref:SIMPL domain-containing protein n=1 Tax=Kineosporia babensis TaxID=499548 RepID=A0A9X1NAK7_9ACTN|nr:SIMPL domain-containing protein [Kineosporia babensis]
MTSGPGQRPGEGVVATVSGSAYAEAMPDRARLHLRVRAAESSAKAAADAFAQALAGARGLLDELGCTYQVGSVASWDGGRQEDRRSRHQVTGQITVTVTDLSLLAGLVERVLEAERLGLEHLQWEVANLRELRRQARVKAIAEAREAAEDYAAALGLRLGPVLSVNDPETGCARPMFAMAAGFGRAHRESAADRPEIDLSNTEPVRVEGAVTVAFLLQDVG